MSVIVVFFKACREVVDFKYLTTHLKVVNSSPIRLLLLGPCAAQLL